MKMFNCLRDGEKRALEKSLRFKLPADFEILELSPVVLAHCEAHKQLKWLSCEAGGQLFASFENPSVMLIVDVTGPRPTDKRSVYNYEPDRVAEQEEIKDRFSRGLHFVGDWHTHKQRIPKPSGTDERSIRELVRCSDHDLSGFILIVVGQAAFPDGLHVSFHSKSGSTTVLRPIADDDCRID
jgi:integrative and conjugative element protein (TIGR02256 family)